MMETFKRPHPEEGFDPDAETHLLQSAASVVRRREEELRVLRESADRDPLTGLMRREAFLSHAETILQGHELGRRKSDPDREIGLFFIDLDNFKKINDNDPTKHEAGDVALKKVADFLRANVRPTDLVGRYGGDEFVVLLVDGDIGQLSAIAIKLKDGIEKLRIEAGGIHVTASVGVAVASAGESAKDLTARADKAMYQAKDSGRNKVVSI